MLMCMGFRLLHLNFLIVILMMGLLRMVGLLYCSGLFSWSWCLFDDMNLH